MERLQQVQLHVFEIFVAVVILHHEICCFLNLLNSFVAALLFHGHHAVKGKFQFITAFFLASTQQVAEIRGHDDVTKNRSINTSSQTNQHFNQIKPPYLETNLLV